MNLLIKNGTVVSSDETKKADIYVKDEKIAAIISDSSLERPPFLDIDKEIDASGKLVMPGGIDVHTHFDMPFMGTKSVDDFETGTLAAAYGGTTSIIDYIIPQKNQCLKKALTVWHEKAKNKAFIDYGFHMAIIPPIDPIIGEIQELKKQGVSSIKCFLAYKNSLMIDDKSLFRLFQEAKKAGILVCIHAEDGESIGQLAKQLINEGKTEPVYHALSRPAVLEEEAVKKVLKTAKLTDSPVYFVHLSTRNALEIITKARKAGQTVYAETCPQYLFLTQDRYLEEGFNGAKYVMSPPLREKKHTKYLLKAVENNIDVIASDHCSFNFNKEKMTGLDNFTKIPNGIPGVETRLPLLFSEMAVKKKISVNKFVEINCTKPAKIFGIQNKGDIKTGMDADISIWDPDLQWTIKSDNLHQNVDYTPFENYKITGKPVTVLLRGTTVIENSKLAEKSKTGKFLRCSWKPFG